MAAGRLQPRQRQQRARGHGAALHVAVHRVHAAMGLEVDAARVEADALADQRDGVAWRGLASWPVGELHDARAAMRIAACHGQERAGAELLEFIDVVEATGPAFAGRQPLQGLPVRQRIQHVGWQCGQPARQVIAGRNGDAAVVGRRGMVVDADLREVRCGRRLGLVLGHGGGVREHRAEDGLQCLGARRARPDAVGMQMQPGHPGLQHGSRQPAREFQPFEARRAGLDEANHRQRMAPVGQARHQGGVFIVTATELCTQQGAPECRVRQVAQGLFGGFPAVQQQHGAIGAGQRLLAQ